MWIGMIFGSKYFAEKCILKNHSRFYVKMCAVGTVACVVDRAGPTDRTGPTDRAGPTDCAGPTDRAARSTATAQRGRLRGRLARSETARSDRARLRGTAQAVENFFTKIFRCKKFVIIIWKLSIIKSYFYSFHVMYVILKESYLYEASLLLIFYRRLSISSPRQSLIVTLDRHREKSITKISFVSFVRRCYCLNVNWYDFWFQIFCWKMYLEKSLSFLPQNVRGRLRGPTARPRRTDWPLSAVPRENRPRCQVCCCSPLTCRNDTISFPDLPQKKGPFWGESLLFS